MIVFNIESPILAGESSSDNKVAKPHRRSCPRASTPSRRRALTRRRKGRVSKTNNNVVNKSVSFACCPFDDETVAVQVHEYDEHDDMDRTQVHSQDYDIKQCRENCLNAVRTTHKEDPGYRKHIVQIFRSRNFAYTEQDLDMLSGSICRGLERKLCKIFSQHRRWAVEGVLHMQDNNDEECMRFFSKRASQPCVNFARLLAIADRKAADEIYAHETDEDLASLLSAGNYWSDSSRSLESTDSIDTVWFTT